MPTFYRGNFVNMNIRVVSNEALGVLDTGYLEDYFGNDGFLSVRHVATGNRYQVPMVPLPAVTPEVDNDAFLGTIAIATLVEDGTYYIEGRVRDLQGNYSILSALDPGLVLGDEDTYILQFDVDTGFAESYSVGTPGFNIRPSVGVRVVRKEEPVSVQVIRDETLLVRQ